MVEQKTFRPIIHILVFVCVYFQVYNLYYQMVVFIVLTSMSQKQ